MFNLYKLQLYLNRRLGHQKHSSRVDQALVTRRQQHYTYTMHTMCGVMHVHTYLISARGDCSTSHMTCVALTYA